MLADKTTISQVLVNVNFRQRSRRPLEAKAVSKKKIPVATIGEGYWLENIDLRG